MTLILEKLFKALNEDGESYCPFERSKFIDDIAKIPVSDVMIYIKNNQSELDNHSLTIRLLFDLLTWKEKTIELAKEIYITYKINLSQEKRDQIFSQCDNSGFNSTTEFMIELGVTDNAIYKTFGRVCCRGKLNLAQKLQTLGKIDIAKDDNKIFNNVCLMNCHKMMDDDVNETLDVLKWLKTMGSTITHKSFVNACKSMDFEKVEWIHSFGTIDINENEDEAFRSCFIFFLDDVNPYTSKIWKWIYDRGGVNIFAKDHELFKNICYQNEYNDLIEWLIDHSNNRYSIETMEKAIYYDFPVGNYVNFKYVVKYKIDGVEYETGMEKKLLRHDD